MVRRLREKQEMTQAQLAKKVGVTQGYIAQLEAGDKKNPSLKVLKDIAKALDVPLTELLE